MVLRVFEAFAGVGSQRMALHNLGIDHEVVAIAEIDKFAIASYTAIHGETLNLGDISQLNTEDIPDHDLFTYSFPCQDISVAGKQAGLDMDSGTRSGLLWECQKVIAVKKPKYLLLENVKNLVGKRHKANFDRWLDWLVEQGYSNYWQVLNAKDYGIPQNRERVFVVSILGEHEPFAFPEKQELTTRLKDLLEPSVPEQFYLDNDKTRALIAHIDYKPTDEIKLNQVGNFEKLANPDKKFNDPQVGRVLDTMGISNALDTMQGGNRQPKILAIGNVNPSGAGMNGNVFSADGLSPTITTNKGEGSKVLIKNATKQGYLEAAEGDGIDIAYPNSNTRRGRVQKDCSPTLQTSDLAATVEFPAIAASRGRNPENPSDRTVGTPTEQRLEFNSQGVSNTITTVQKDNYCVENPPFRIRKLTPLECWRLMGFTDEDFYKAQAVNSNSQLYKQAGNSIVVPVLEGIFSQLFISNKISLLEVA